MRVLEFQIRGFPQQGAEPSERPDPPSRWTETGVTFLVVAALFYLAAHLQPALKLPPLPEFAAQPLGSSSPIATVLVANTGTAPLTIGNAVLEGEEKDDFVLETAACVSHALAPGRNCFLGVGFQPQVEGTRIARLVITGNDPASPHVLPLTGTGFRALVPKPVASVSPTSHDFGGLELGNRIELPVEIANEGDGTLHVDSITLSDSAGGVWTTDVQPCENKDVAPNGACNITIAFAPATTVPYATHLTIAHNAGDPLSVDFAGQGLSPHGYCCRDGRIEKLDAESCKRLGGFFSTDLAVMKEKCKARDTQPPPTPTGLRPGNPERMPLAYVWPCTAVRLAWNQVSDPSSPVTYHVTLQQPDILFMRMKKDPWKNITDVTDVHETSIDVTAWVNPAPQKPALSGRALYIYRPPSNRPTQFRWRVGASDFAGNGSAPSGWVYFACQPPPIG